MRFMTAYLSVMPGTHTITGTERMKRRPIGILVDALRKLGVPYTFVSRKPEEGMAIGYGELRSFDFSHPTLIVNATPVGMFPDTERSPWPCPEVLNGHCMVYDLTYNPSPTLLMRQAAAQGAKTKDGLEMLHLQAALSWELYKR